MALTIISVKPRDWPEKRKIYLDPPLPIYYFWNFVVIGRSYQKMFKTKNTYLDIIYRKGPNDYFFKSKGLVRKK